MTNRHMRRCSKSLGGNVNQNHVGITSHLIVVIKKTSEIISNLVRMRNGDLYALLMGIATVNLWKKCGESIKISAQNCHMIQQVHFWIFIQVKVKILTLKDLHTAPCVVYNSQDTEMTQVSVHQWMRD